MSSYVENALYYNCLDITFQHDNIDKSLFYSVTIDVIFDLSEKLRQCHADDVGEYNWEEYQSTVSLCLQNSVSEKTVIDFF